MGGPTRWRHWSVARRCVGITARGCDRTGAADRGVEAGGADPCRGDTVGGFASFEGNTCRENDVGGGHNPRWKTMHAVEPIEKPHAAELFAARIADETSPMVTITGCLESDEQIFKLKDTTGLDAPTSRSWKTGFLKKRSASIEVSDTANGVSLTNHVGQRVALTGTLLDREMNVRSVRRLADSCK